MSELTGRVLTALVLVPLFVAALIWLPPAVLALLLGAIVAIGAREWASLVGYEGAGAKWSLVIITIAMMALVFPQLTPDSLIPLLLAALAVLWWLFAVALILRREAGHQSAPQGLPGAALGVFVLVSTWSSVLTLRQDAAHGAGTLVFFFVVIWLADSAAYFTGKRWGARRLSPNVSPGKTLEGCAGAILSVAILLVLAGLWAGLETSRLLMITVLAVLAVIFSIVGDLFESLMKRRQNLKDSGQLLPGHGGVLDRIDSITAAAPVVALGLHLLGD